MRVRLREREGEYAMNVRGTFLFVFWHKLDFGVKVSQERERDLVAFKGS